MKPLYLALGATLAVACVCGAIIFYVLGAERAKDALDDARDYIEGTKDADEATDDVRRAGACNWLRETFGGEGCGVVGPDTPVD